ncbi:MAG: hypothetical protein ACFFEY_14485 [Candidatus Thorarchaeota archaeon]
MKKKLKVTKALITASFFICIVAIVTPVMAAGSNLILFMAIGDDLDINASDLIVGKIEVDEAGEPSSVQVVFHQRIYDESGKKVYSMWGKLKDGLIEKTDHYFLCPVFGVWFINVWWFMGMGVYKTTDTNYDIIYRNWFPITLPNTEGKYVSVPILMFMSLTGEYCLQDPGAYTPGTSNNPVYIMEQGGWALTGVLCGIIVQTPFGPTELPIGPASFLTKYLEN